VALNDVAPVAFGSHHRAGSLRTGLLASARGSSSLRFAFASARRSARILVASACCFVSRSTAATANVAFSARRTSTSPESVATGPVTPLSPPRGTHGLHPPCLQSERHRGELATPQVTRSNRQRRRNSTGDVNGYGQEACWPLCPPGVSLLSNAGHVDVRQCG
jgi:hypothetical protein